ncbi:HEAT repeat domain-containing protein [Mucilaginibacter terrae]|uniref:CRISPR/Cas system CSM-associated protein Csm2 small subunit n=1 Tax=Mucilaginibacter terrae TaxID=1955052 RepID=A0ABU3GV93_9SPHI|nr:hypothetical protein [Mucilaginibacter terrae]MDT3403694.1 CRISPR/Cas system CSM-associated protein Csm2 small subunit [Mucilaginibacter terrae]
MKGRLEDFINEHSEELNHRTPNPEVLNRILKQMGHEAPVHKEEPKKGIIISFNAMRWAAAACLLLALGFGLWKFSANKDVEEATSARIRHKITPATQLPDTTVAQPTEVAANKQLEAPTNRFEDIDKEIALRKNQLAQNVNRSEKASAYKKVLFDKLNDETSPAVRIKALSQTNKLKSMSNDVVDALVETMNHDPNTNVRLAALDGLAKFYKEAYVKKQLIKSLKKQNDPMVQIELIGLLTRMKESAILTELEGMVTDENNIPAVRETAYTGMFELKKS